LDKQVNGLTGGYGYQYFTFNFAGMEKFLKNLKEYAEFSNRSRFLDLGSGRGHLVFCVASILNPVMSYGVEGDDCRHGV
jgi:tRNA1(Val) A37 N6-methylase TrmN6